MSPIRPNNRSFLFLAQFEQIKLLIDLCVYISHSLIGFVSFEQPLALNSRNYSLPQALRQPEVGIAFLFLVKIDEKWLFLRIHFHGMNHRDKPTQGQLA